MGRARWRNKHQCPSSRVSPHLPVHVHNRTGADAGPTSRLTPLLCLLMATTSAHQPQTPDPISAPTPSTPLPPTLNPNHPRPPATAPSQHHQQQSRTTELHHNPTLPHRCPQHNHRHRAAPHLEAASFSGFFMRRGFLAMGGLRSVAASHSLRRVGSPGAQPPAGQSREGQRPRLLAAPSSCP